MKGLPRSGRPIRQKTWRTPSVPEIAAIGGGTAVGIGFSAVGLRRCSCARRREDVGSGAAAALCSSGERDHDGHAWLLTYTASCATSFSLIIDIFCSNEMRRGYSFGGVPGGDPGPDRAAAGDTASSGGGRPGSRTADAGLARSIASARARPTARPELRRRFSPFDEISIGDVRNLASDLGSAVITPRAESTGVRYVQPGARRARGVGPLDRDAACVQW